MGTAYVAVVSTVAERCSVRPLVRTLDGTVTSDAEAVFIAAYRHFAAVTVGEMMESGTSTERTFIRRAGDK